VSLIGVDDFEWSDIMRLKPTLIAQPIEEMTRAAIGALLLQVEEGTPPSGQRILFPPKLIERSSCGPPLVESAPPICVPRR
jgi:LacI family transcriptional regulator